MSALTGTASMLGLTLRRERVHATAWYGSTGLLLVLIGVGILGTYPTESARADLAAIVNSDAGELFLIGPLASTSIGGLVVWRTLGIATILTALGSTFVVGRNTRASEENGTAELLGASATGRAAPLGAALIVAAAGSLLAGVLVAVGYTASGAEVIGSVLAGAQVAALGCLFAAVAGLTGQIMRTSRGATGLSVIVLAALYLARGALDAAGASPWFTPLGWIAAVRPSAGDDPLALLPVLALTGVVAALGLRIASRRDLGAGLLPDRPGRAVAARSLRGPLSLALRVSRSTIIGSSAALAVVGLLIGAVASTVDQQIDLDLGGGRPGFANTALYLAPEIITVFALATLLRARADVTSGRAEILLAAPVRRGRWLLAHAATAGIAAVAALLGLGIGVGTAEATVTGDATQIIIWAWASTIRAPAVWLLIALTTLVLAGAPRLAAATGSTALGAVVALEFAVEIQVLPSVALYLSPYALVPQLPGGPAHLGFTAVVLLVASALAWTASRLVRRIDLREA